jgi:hypothetical protein
MLEQGSVGQPDPGSVSVEHAAAEQQALQNQQPPQPPAPPAPVVPDKFAGKSIEDVVRSYQEVEKFAGDKAREVGELRSQMNYLTGLMQQQLAQQQAQQAPPPPQPQGPQFNWDKPEDSVRGVARTEVMQAMEAMRYQQAASMAEIAKSSAMRDNPQVFQGLDVSAVDQVMQQGLRQRLIAPESVGKPETWVMAAWQLRGAQSGYGANYSPTPVKPVQTEQPTGSRGNYESEPVTLGEGEAQIIKQWGKAMGKELDPQKFAQEISADRRRERR